MIKQVPVTVDGFVVCCDRCPARSATGTDAEETMDAAVFDGWGLHRGLNRTDLCRQCAVAEAISRGFDIQYAAEIIPKQPPPQDPPPAPRTPELPAPDE